MQPKCPTHHMTDCSPLLNGCSWFNRLEHYCSILHWAYKHAAQANGWETQARSRVPWADVPEENKATMRWAVATLLGHIRDEEK